MGEVAFDATEAFADSKWLAAAVIRRESLGNFHSGLLYKRNGEVRVLHLAGNKDLQNEWLGARLWAAPQVEPERLFALGAMCQRIWLRFLKDPAMLPYAFMFSQSKFTDKGVVRGPGSQGMTCATFVLAMFNSIGLQLIDEDSWPIRKSEDLALLEILRPIMALPDGTPSGTFSRISNEVNAEPGVRRIRPEEVLGACAYEPPVQFAQCEIQSRRVIALLAASP